MFERRLKIFFGILAGIIALLVIRAGQIQILQADSWREVANDSVCRTSYPKTTRGRILDFRNRELAVDAPCIDAAVDYRALMKNERWIRDQALSRLLNNDPAYKNADKETRQRLLDDQCLRVCADIDKMFDALADESGQTREQIEETKQSIRQRVEIRRRIVWYNHYNKAVEKYKDKQDKDERGYREFLLSDEPLPQIDNFELEISEQSEPHVILPAISPESHSRLKKKIDQYPGLALIPSLHRYYPYNETACHIIGCLSSVVKDEHDGMRKLLKLLADDICFGKSISKSLADDPLIRKLMQDSLANEPWISDPRKQYLPNDLAGRWGVEALCENTLRGLRGKIEKNTLNDEILEQISPEPGKDVKLTIDIALQKEIEAAFHDVKWKEGNKIVEEHAMYGAAVVIDLKSGQLRALVSYPTYNLNTYVQDYHKLASDVINRPLLNRATQAALVPGSTVKPLVAIGALTGGYVKLNERIECKGYLVIDGKTQTKGRCWTTRWSNTLGRDANHEHVPYGDPHTTGQLDVIDAIQRSCNVYFENMGERMRLDGLSNAFDRFGLGKPVGIGLTERRGQLPIEFHKETTANDPQKRSAAWFSAIGQVGVLATPLQMAAAHAAIARDGVYIRPTIVLDGLPENALKNTGPDRYDMRIPPEFMRAVKEGMWKVVNTEAGSGYGVRRADIPFAGKTGTAQAGKFSYPVKDEEGKTVLFFPEISSPQMPWYRGSGRENKELSHAWFVGFAPYDHPKIAFAVMLEYGGGGGDAAGKIVEPLIEACLKNGYL